MKVTNFPLLNFGADETFDVAVRQSSPHHVSATPITAHRMNGLATAAPASRACRAWPMAQGLIYVVDNFPGLAQFAKTVLELEGFATCAFDDRATAWQAFAFAATRPAVLITDNLAGDVEAMELIRRCRSVEPTLKTLLVDHRLPVGRPNPDQALVDGLLSLPYCGPTLVQEVRRLFPASSGVGRTWCECDQLLA